MVEEGKSGALGPICYSGQALAPEASASLLQAVFPPVWRPQSPDPRGQGHCHHHSLWPGAAQAQKGPETSLLGPTQWSELTLSWLLEEGL